jgi:hypothetical protein
MLLRFREDVINLKPKKVVILAGTNDIAENNGPISLDKVFGNIVSMVELAKANKIKVVICSVLPASEYPWRKGMEKEKLATARRLLSMGLSEAQVATATELPLEEIQKLKE